ncbi:MAG: hypothetical protein AVDCRST_MAG90-1295 [uncultured Microvirga sp.]|uniref:Uncharacterized protein n=1 Tax=uncultured Microvirga sp. TaxID=412392 RepID=A0A6J4LCE8_9HYPH|nr:MAG: hypothetical protein AVDCRST_MAG90-1295 [uncultured Microvirga sp.]
MLRTRPSPHVPGFDRRRLHPEPRACDVIIATAAVVALLAGALRLLAAA